MNKTLFQITDEMYKLIEYGCDAEGEIPQTQEEFNLMYDAIQLELTTKIDNTNCLSKSLKGEVALIDKEIERLQSLKKQKEQLSNWLLKRVDTVLKLQYTDEDGVLDIEGLKKAVKEINKKLPHSSLSYRTSNSIEITNADLVPTEMKNVKVEEAPNKTKIKEYFGENEITECEYARIKTNYNLSVK